MTLGKFICISISAFVFFSSCDKNENANPPPPVTNPQVAFEEFELALKTQSSGCKVEVSISYDGESFKDYSTQLTCPEPSYLKDYEPQIEPLSKIVTLAEQAERAPGQTLTRINMAKSVGTAFSKRITNLKSSKEKRLSSLTGHAEALRNLKALCTETAEKFTCPQETLFSELAKNYSTYTDYIKAANEAYGYKEIAELDNHRKIFEQRIRTLQGELDVKFQDLLKKLTVKLQNFESDSITKCESKKINIARTIFNHIESRAVRGNSSLENALDSLSIFMQSHLDVYCDRLTSVSKMTIMEESRDAKMSLTYYGEPEINIPAHATADQVSTLFQNVPHSSILKPYTNFMVTNKNYRNYSCRTLFSVELCILTILKFSEKAAEFALQPEEEILIGNETRYYGSYNFKMYYLDYRLTADEALNFIVTSRTNNK